MVVDPFERTKLAPGLSLLRIREDVGSGVNLANEELDSVADFLVRVEARGLDADALRFRPVDAEASETVELGPDGLPGLPDISANRSPICLIMS